MPEPDGGALAQIAGAIGARVVDEDGRGELLATAQRVFGSGPTAERRHEGERLALMPYVTLLALVPLAFLLWRRNL